MEEAKTPIASLEGAPELMTVRQAALRLGVSSSTLYGALKRGDIPIVPFVIGRTRWLPRRQLELWLEGGDVQARLKAERRRRGLSEPDDFGLSA